jgi:hypothetical protein
MQHNFQDPLAILLAQIITIILVAEFFGWFSKNWSALSNWGDNRWYCTWAFFIRSLFLQNFQEFCFSILGNLKFLSQIGLNPFMFYRNGTRFKSFKNKANEAVWLAMRV